MNVKQRLVVSTGHVMYRTNVIVTPDGLAPSVTLVSVRPQICYVILPGISYLERVGRGRGWGHSLKSFRTVHSKKKSDQIMTGNLVVLTMGS